MVMLTNYCRSCGARLDKGKVCEICVDNPGTVSKPRYADNLSEIENISRWKPYTKETKEFYEKNMWLTVIIVVIAVASPFLGLILVGPAGIVVGLILSVASFLVGPKAIMKVKETTRHET